VSVKTSKSERRNHSDKEKAFFQNIVPLYPVLDEATFQDQLADYYNGHPPVNRLWLTLAKIVIYAGAASLPDQERDRDDVSSLRDALYSEVLSSVHLTYMSMNVGSVQILFITVSQPFAVINLSFCNSFLNTWLLKANVITRPSTARC
jgi:hypothetical protein